METANKPEVLGSGSAAMLGACFDAAVLSCLDVLQGDELGDLTRFQKDPLTFCREILGVRLWSKQAEILSDMVDHDRITVRAARGVGKTRLAAVALTWLLLCFPGTVIVSTAPVWDQVKELLWREIHDLYANAPVRLPGELLDTSWEIGPKWFAIGRSTNKPERFAGFHASPILAWQWELSDAEFWKRIPEVGQEEGGVMAVFYDEASGIADQIHEIAAGFGTTRRFKEFAFSNPTSDAGWFYRSHQDPKDAKAPGELLSTENKKAVEWKRYKISSWDVLTHAPRLYSEDYIARARQDWGAGSTMWTVHVEGEFPTEGPDTLFAVHSMEACEERRHDWLGQPLKGLGRDQQGALQVPCIFCIDVGSTGSGETVIYVIRGDFIECMYAWREGDPLKTEKQIHTLAARHKPQSVKIDTGHIGLSLAAHLRIGAPTEVGGAGYKPLHVVGVDFGSQANDPQRYRRRRDEMLWRLAQRIKEGRLSGLKDERTKGQLAQLHWHEDPVSKRICVETVDELEKRNIPSPDRASALAILEYVGATGGVVHETVKSGLPVMRF